MTDLRVIVDDILVTERGGLARYAEELTRALISTAPEGSHVIGVVAASPEPDYARLTELLPGLAGLEKSALERRELRRSWRHGITRIIGSPMVHSPSLMAPLHAHDRANNPTDQTVVTVHDAIAWTDPELVAPRELAWQRAMIKRAEKYADAIVVPSHAVAVQLDEAFGFGDRLRVIPGAPSRSLRTPVDADERADTLGLPEQFILTVADTSQRKGLASLLEAWRSEQMPLVIAAGSDADAVREAAGGIDAVTVFGALADPDLATLYDRAALYVQPSLAEGFGLAVLEALDHGIPVVHTDDPALVETTSGAAIVVPREGDDSLADRLGAAIHAVLNRPDARAKLSTAATDRARTFSWRDSAERVWQLHADL